MADEKTPNCSKSASITSMDLTTVDARVSSVKCRSSNYNFHLNPLLEKIMQKKSITKTVPTFFPLGFGIGKVDGGDILVVEFYDQIRDENDQLSVIGAFALTAKKAQDLVEALAAELPSADNAEENP